MDYEKKYMTAFLNALEKHNVIWDRRCIGFTTRKKKNLAYEEMLQVMQIFDYNADIFALKKRISYIKIRYQLELSRIRESKEYKPKIWWFSLAHFLDTGESTTTQKDSKLLNKKGDEGSIKQRSDSTTIAQQERMTTKQCEFSSEVIEDCSATTKSSTTLPDTNATKLRTESTETPNENPSPTDFDCSFSIETPMKVWLSNYDNSKILEPEDPFDEDSKLNSTVTAEKRSSEDEELLVPLNQTQRKSLKRKASTKTTNKMSGILKKSSSENSGENSKRKKVSSDELKKSSEKMDSCGIFGEHVAMKLRRYSKETVNLVQHYINNILFQADMNMLKAPQKSKCP